MKRLICICCLWLLNAHVYAQQPDVPLSERQLESQSREEEINTENDADVQELEMFRKHPVNLNTADKNELAQLGLLTDLQTDQLIAYRNRFGHFLSVYELQAVPSLDIETIRSIIPFVTTAILKEEPAGFRNRFRNGEHLLLLRSAYKFDSKSLYDTSHAGYYQGSRWPVLLRYRYTYKNLLRYGITADKDAGEPFLRGKQKYGFDFYSFHFFSKHSGFIKTMALGDYTINLGQGLVQWQSMAFRKSSEVMSVKRQGPLLRPYSSSGESGFYRGAAVETGKGNWKSLLFVSSKWLSAHSVTDSAGDVTVSSVLLSGYHRTSAENAERNVLRLNTAGFSQRYDGRKFNAGINALYYHYSLPLQKKDALYNAYAFSGDDGFNVSADYSFTRKNIHFFGEAALDANRKKAFLQGMLISADARVDIAVLYRNIHPAFQAPFGNAFTENTLPGNENGFYIGTSMRPVSGIRFDAYADFYRFPWLKYQHAAPSDGFEYLVQLVFTPSRKIEMYTRYRVESKQQDATGGMSGLSFLVPAIRKNWRTQFSFSFLSGLICRSRVEFVSFRLGELPAETGFLGFTDLLYKPMLKPFSLACRFSYFETAGYNSRVYAFENDLLYSFSIPARFGKGFHYYFMVNYDLGRSLSTWFRWAQTLEPGPENTVGGEEGKSSKELKIQLIYKF